MADSTKEIKKNKFAFFSGIPVLDSALLYRLGVLAKELVKRGCQVRVFSVSESYYENIQRDIRLDFELISVGQAHYRRGKDNKRERLNTYAQIKEVIKILFRLKRQLKLYHPDILQTFTSSPASCIVAIFFKLFGYKVYMDIDDLVSEQARKASYGILSTWIIKFLEERVPLICDRVSVCSQYLQDKYKNSVRIPNCIEIKRLNNLMFQGKFKHKEELWVIFVGTIGYYHGQQEVIEIIPKIISQNKKIKFLFIGSGDIEKDLKILVERLGIGENVVFTGQIPHDEVIRYELQSDIGILPLWDEPLYQARHPLKLLEYMASRTAIVTSDVGEVSIILKDRESAWIGRPGNLDDIAEGILRLSRDEDLRNRLVENAYKIVNNFDIEEVMKRWLSFYGDT